MTEQPHQGWIADLSDGRTALEGEVRNPGDPSAWQQLLSMCRETGTTITRMRLQRAGVTIHTLPVKACEGYFQAYEFRRLINSGQEETRQGVGSVVGDRIYITWINAAGYIYQEIRELEGNKIHTTL
jgi:hypothetical protein